MQYEVSVDGRVLMLVRYVSDAWAFILDRRSMGAAVVVKHLPSGRVWSGCETVDEIVGAVCG